MEESIQIKNQSGDHKYFTIIPNYILNHSTATAQALYLQLKRLAGENGVAYPASRYLRERLKITQPTLRKEFNYLIQRGWIEFDGVKQVSTDGGLQKIKSYKIIDLWELNNKFYQRGEKIDTPYQGGEKIDTPLHAKGVKTRGEKIDTKEEPSEEELYKDKVFLETKKTTMQKLQSEDAEDLPVIVDGGYLNKKKPNQNDNWNKFVIVWKAKCFKEKKIDPEIMLSKDKPIFHRINKIYTNTQMLGIIDFFLKSKKSDEHITISACFSADTINQYKLHARDTTN